MNQILSFKTIGNSKEKLKKVIKFFSLYKIFFGIILATEGAFGYYQNKNKKVIIGETPNISIKNLNFKYNNESNNILEDININIPYGSFIGILGKTGSGKTTLANILTKFYKIENKKVFFDNIDINDINRTSFYEKISYVMQEDYIYDNIVKYNIDLGKYYTETKIKKALEQSELLNTIENFPQKYETYIGEDGIKISGGQKQRLILSRNIVSTPKILIIDDGLTGLDLETRKKIIENITKNKNITLIVISNMIEDIKEADKIYILENKTLKELEV